MHKSSIWAAIIGIFFTALSSAQQLKVLHLGFHRGCINDFEYVAQHLGINLTSVYIHDKPSQWLDGKTTGSAIYNIGHDRAVAIWEKHKDYFDQFDVILTSDTAPLSRIFLQNNWQKPLIIWICNRFDYCDEASRDCHFPDPEYYQLFRDAMNQSNVHIIAYTPFEHYYAKLKGIDIGSRIIKPCALPDNNFKESLVPAHINKHETFFIPPYHNETIFFNFAEHCRKLGIPVYGGRYNGPGDLREFKGIIHLPYGWSNVALFENIQNGVPYFIPSKEFFAQLKKQHNYWFQDSCHIDMVELSEWYTPDHKDLFIYFDSWQDLAAKIKNTDYAVAREKTLQIAQRHHDAMLDRWKKIFDTIKQ
jgi:hypothetical protein